MNKKKNLCSMLLVAVFLAVVFTILLSPPKDIENGGENKEQNELQEEIRLEDDTIEFATSEKVQKINKENETFNAILIGEKSFIDFESGKDTTIFTLPSINDNYQALSVPERYAAVDLDNNGTEELLVEYSIAGDTAILNFEKEKIVAYHISFRGRQEVKVDGSLHWSSSATESGVQKVSFGRKGMILTDTLVYSDELYALEGNKVSKEECENALKKEWEKEDIEWFSIP